MALTVNTTKIQNTDIEVSNVYVRIQSLCLSDGKKVANQLTSYLSKEDFLANKPVVTEIPTNVMVVLSETENQDIDTIHNAIVGKLSELGVVASIV
tara:strand:- start:508 stop:795 length:288 start_codon:yes stop_codon:yes gene_type:complete